MARYKLLATTSAKAGRDEEFNAWYDDRHMPDVLAVPGFVSAERFISMTNEGPKYLAIYEVETDDIAATMAEFGRRPGTDLMPVSDSLDFSAGQIGFWKSYLGEGRLE